MLPRVKENGDGLMHPPIPKLRVETRVVPPPKIPVCRRVPANCASIVVRFLLLIASAPRRDRQRAESALHLAFYMAHSWSSMADPTIFELLEPMWIKPVFGKERATSLCLALWFRPLHVEDLVFRSQVLLRRFMTIQAPAHIERVRFPGERHFIDSAVAGGATDALLHVNAVVEEHKIRHLIDPLPDQRLPG